MNHKGGIMGISMDFARDHQWSHYLPPIFHHLPHLQGSGPYHKTWPPWRWSQEGRSISTFEGFCIQLLQGEKMPWLPWLFESFWPIKFASQLVGSTLFSVLEYTFCTPPALPKRLHLVLYRRIERSGALSAAGPTHSSDWLVPQRQVRGNNLKAFHLPYRRTHSLARLIEFESLIFFSCRCGSRSRYGSRMSCSRGMAPGRKRTSPRLWSDPTDSFLSVQTGYLKRVKFKDFLTIMPKKCR